MGWNKISVNRDNLLIPKGHDYKFYFVHSYYVELNDESLQIALVVMKIIFLLLLKK